MNFKEASKLLREIEQEIKDIEFELWANRNEAFGLPQDQISDFGDAWSSEETTHHQAREKQRKVKRLKFLRKSKEDLFDFKFEKRCIDCGVVIEKNRLMARPGATRCIRCQRFHEAETFEAVLRDRMTA